MKTPTELNNKVIFGDSLEVLKTIPDESVQMCVTSPPYWGLRDYGTGKWLGGDEKCDHVRTTIRKGVNISDSPVSTKGGGKKIAEVPEIQYSQLCKKCGAVREDQQIGLEETPGQYIQRLILVFREVKRVLKEDGTLWVNIGDSYCNNAQSGGGDPTISKRNLGGIKQPNISIPNGLKPKDLVGIPWMLAFALRADGWYLRQDIIWSKPNNMPESVTDRCTKAHEYIFLLSKSKTYYYNHEAIKENCIQGDNVIRDREDTKLNNTPGRTKMNGLIRNDYTTKNKRSIWHVATKPYSGAHFAVYPPELIKDCIKAGSKEGDIVLDPFFGSRTTGEVALRLYRKYLGIELNKEYEPLILERLKPFKQDLFITIEQ